MLLVYLVNSPDSMKELGTRTLAVILSVPLALVGSEDAR